MGRGPKGCRFIQRGPQEGFGREDGEEVAQRRAGEHIGGMMFAGFDARSGGCQGKAGKTGVGGNASVW